jgi:hypothetical protein
VRDTGVEPHRRLTQIPNRKSASALVPAILGEALIEVQLGRGLARINNEKSENTKKLSGQAIVEVNR